MSVLAVLLLLTLLPAAAAHAQTYSVLHRFAGGGDGAYPWAGLTLRDGNLYGTTRQGGNYSDGTAFELERSGPNWTMSPIYFFQGSDGFWPQSRIVFGPDGHSYGTTSHGGASGGGVVYQLTPEPLICKTLRCFWKGNAIFDVWHQMYDLNWLGYGDLVWDANGNMFGAAEWGGPQNDGGIYELTCSENGCTGGPIYIFSGPDGKNPDAVFVDSNGNAFVTTPRGGKYDHGTVVELSYQPGIGWSKVFQYDFQDGIDGRGPDAGLISDGAGNLIGTAGGGSAGGGTVFELSPVGNSWTLNVLYDLPALCSPTGALALDSAGNLYGSCAATNGLGNIFKLVKVGDTWTYSSVHDFTSYNNWFDGSAPNGNISIDTDGTLYGTTASGGRCKQDGYGCGVVWMIKP